MVALVVDYAKSFRYFHQEIYGWRLLLYVAMMNGVVAGRR